VTAMATVQVEQSVVDAIAAAVVARDAGMAQAEEADRSGWNTSLIDTAIRAFADTGRDFSANDVRVVLPDDVPGPLMGARFSAAQTLGQIRFRGYVRSSKVSTHSKRIAMWRGSTPTT
jgi:hypothetical protein